jgi:putative ABC transport system permease protein
MNVITRGVRNAFRNQIRTFSIVVILGLSVGMALAMLVARQAVSEKISSVKSSVGNTVSISPAGVRGFDGGGNPLTDAEIAKVSSLAHVASVTKTLQDRLSSTDTSLQSAVDAGALGRRFALNNGSGSTTSPTPPAGDVPDSTGTATRSFTPPVTVIGTTKPTSLANTQGGGTFKLTSGKVIDGNSSDNVALIGSSIATKNNLKVGSTFTAYGQTITVAGIFDAGNTFSNNQVIMPLKTVQTLSSQAGDVTGVTLNVDSIENVASVTTAASNALGTAADVTNASERANVVVAPLQNIQTISLYSLIGAVVAGAIIILLTMIMIVRERRREIGVLKAIGASNVKVMGQFASEAVTFTILGAIIGIIFGTVAGNPITRMLVNNSTSTASTGGFGGPGRGFGGRGFGAVSRGVSSITAHVGLDIILYGLLVAIIIAIIGSALASFFIAKVRPAEVMRAE